MFTPQLYAPVYYIVLALITLFLSIRYAQYPAYRVGIQQKQTIGYSLILLVAVLLFIGLRPLSWAFVDMRNYYIYYNKIIDGGIEFSFDFHTQNILFDNLFNWMALSGININVLFFFIAFIYFTFMWLACRKWFPKDTLYAFVIYLSAFSTFSYGTNGIKAGAAASIFMLALSYRHKSLLLSILLALISWGFHHSMYVVIFAYILVLLVNNPKYYLYGWFLCIVFALLKINPLQQIMLALSDESGSEYLTSTESEGWHSAIGFRPDFLLYSAIPVLIGFYTIFKSNIKSIEYTMLFNIYLTLNSLWILCMYIPYNNRIAYLSWFLLPIVSVYPMFRLDMWSKQYKILNLVVWIYMSFSLFAVYFF